MKHLFSVIAWVAIAGIGIIGFGLIYLLADALDISNSDALQIEISVALIGVTTAYVLMTNKIAVATKQQADASAGAVEEMRLQRQDAVLPIIDIVEDVSSTERIEIGGLRKEGKFPQAITCWLKNVGFGPAFDVRYDYFLNGVSKTQTVPTILKGQVVTDVNEAHDEKDLRVLHGPTHLGVRHESDGTIQLVVEYRDISDNRFISRKELIPDNYAELLGPLRFERVKP